MKSNDKLQVWSLGNRVIVYDDDDDLRCVNSIPRNSLWPLTSHGKDCVDALDAM